MDKKGVSKDNIHLIGLSLGAHLAGYIGKVIPGIRRITGKISVNMFLAD
jgi:phosphatidic acid-selective phospholipase A1